MHSTFIYLLFLTVLGLCCFADFSLVAVSWGYSVAVPGLLIAVASLVEHGLSSCDTRALVHLRMWNLPGSGVEPMSLALASGLPSHRTTRKSSNMLIRYASLLQRDCHHSLSEQLHYITESSFLFLW